MKPKVIVNGARGKMGALACETLQASSDFELVAQLSRQDNLAQSIAATQADIVVDLTRADCVFANTKCIIEAGAHPIIGTTGLLAQEMAYLTALCQEKKLGGLIVPNFSLAAVLMMQFAVMAARFFQHVEIIEMHHPQKCDAPSGTAIQTAEMIAHATLNPLAAGTCKEILPHARGANYENIHIHSLRLSGVLAQQQVIFGNAGETLSISHNCIDRQSFMPGLLLACKKVSSLHALYYGLDHLLN